LFELVLRIGFSLLVVFGLMWVLAKAVRRPLGGRRGTGSLSVLNRQQLTRGAAVAVVRAGDKALILGITDQQVSLLGEAELSTFEKPFEDHDHRDPVQLMPGAAGRLDGSILAPRTWRSTMNFLRDRTMRR
jgi:flagellar protein FliO/FliZ